MRMAVTEAELVALVVSAAEVVATEVSLAWEAVLVMEGSTGNLVVRPAKAAVEASRARRFRGHR